MRAQSAVLLHPSLGGAINLNEEEDEGDSPGKVGGVDGESDFAKRRLSMADRGNLAA